MTGVVLAGGRSRRMGRDKAWIPVGGRPLVLHQADRLAEVFDDVVVAAKAEGPFAALGLRVVRDEEAEHAPIFGIRAALAGIGRPIFALAVDLPRFPPPLAAALARDLLDTGAPCVAPEAGGVVQGLCAAYSPEILPAIDRRIGEGRLSVRDLVAESGGAVRDGRFWGPFSGPEAFENWNRPDDPSVRHEA